MQCAMCRWGKRLWTLRQGCVGQALRRCCLLLNGGGSDGLCLCLPFVTRWCANKLQSVTRPQHAPHAHEHSDD